MTIFVLIWRDEEMIFGDVQIFNDKHKGQEQGDVVATVRNHLAATHLDVRFENCTPYGDRLASRCTMWRVQADNLMTGDREFLGLLVGVEP